MKLNKTLAIASVAFLVAAGITFGVMSRIHNREVAEIQSSHILELRDLRLEEAAVQAHSDSVDFVNAQKQLKIDSLVKADNRHKWDIDRLENELIDAWNEIFDADYDKNYSFLQNRYPSDDSLVYPFAGEQVKGIALDLVRSDYKDSIMHKMLASDKDLRAQLLTGKEIINSLYEEKDDWEILRKQLYERLAAKTEELQMSETEAAELKRKLRVRTAGGAGAIIGLATLLFLL